MARGTEIIVSPQPRGVFLEGVIKAAETPRPGTIVQLDVSAGVSANTGRWTFEIYNRDADSNRPHGPWIILLNDIAKNTYDPDTLLYSAYAAGDWAQGYVPIAGEEFNLILANLAGTADDHAIGEVLIVDDGTGKLIANTGSPETEPFVLWETVTDPTADTLRHVMYNGY